MLHYTAHRVKAVSHNRTGCMKQEALQVFIYSTELLCYERQNFTMHYKGCHSDSEALTAVPTLSNSIYSILYNALDLSFGHSFI